MKKQITLFWLLTILLLAACNSGGTEPTANDADNSGAESALEEMGTDTPVPATDTPVPPTADTSEDDTTMPADVTLTPPLADLPPEQPVIIFYQTGGIMGLMDEWRFFPDGTLINQDGEQWQLAPTQVEEILATAVAGDFFNMAESYMPENTCCDFFTYTVEINYGAQNHTVTTMDNATNAPQELLATIQAVQDILRVIREGGQPGPEQ